MTESGNSTRLVGRLGLIGALVVALGIGPGLALAAGTGAFVPHLTKPGFGAGNSLAVELADLDGDDDLDAILVHPGSLPETVWLNDGTGRYMAHPTAPIFGSTDGPTVAISLGDLDGDDDIDAVVAHGGNSTGTQAETVWLNDGTGAFAPHPTAPSFNAVTGHFFTVGLLGWDTRNVALGDMDGDGDLDAVVVDNGGNYLTRTISIWSNDGSGGFSGGTFFGRPDAAFNGSKDVKLGDLDGDGDLDVVVSNSPARGDEAWINDGSGGLQFRAVFGGHAGQAVALGDLDGDGDLDAIMANVAVPPETVWVNDGTGGFSPHPTTPNLPGPTYDSRDVALADLDGDSDLDAVFANYNQPETVWTNDGAGNMTPHPTTPTFGSGHSEGLALGDLDSDGDSDVVVANFFLQPATVWMNTNVQNVAPDADAGGPYSVAEGNTVALDGSGTSDLDADDVLSYEWDLDGDGLYGETGADASRGGETGVSPTFTAAGLDGPQSWTAMLRVTDLAGASDSDTALITVANVAPAVTLGSDATIDEGGALADSGSFLDPGADSWTATVDYGDGSGVAPLSLNPDGSFSLGHPYVDDGAYTVTVIVEDDDGEPGAAALTVTVNNLAPDVGDISGPVDPVQVSTSVSVTAGFTDPGSPDTHAAMIDWGDGSVVSADELSQLAGGGSVAGSHVYTSAGVYTLTLTVTDDDGGVGQAVYQYIVVYDPAGGFVTGAGSIESPAGAYAADPFLSGTARFGFVSKYKKGANVPDGQTRFQFQTASLRFESTAYDWLVIAGSKAQFKGSGQIDGAGNYGFMLTTVDGALGGGSDTFRIKIWDKDNGDAIVYDNQMGAALDADPTTGLTSGSIVIHAPTK